MTCTNGQQRGATTRLVFDFETAPKTAKAYANRTPKLIPFNAADIAATAPLNAVETIRGDRNPSEPFTGFTEVSGDIAAPVDTNVVGLYLKAALGQPVSHLTANPSVSGQNHMTGTPQLTIASSGAYTFSVAQASSAVEDVVVYTDGTSYFIGRISARTNDTTGTLQTIADPVADPATGTFTVVAIIDNVLAYDVGEIDVAAGVFDLSGSGWASADIRAGDLIVYGNGLIARVLSDLASFQFRGVLVNGETPPNGVALDGHAIIRAGIFRHVFTTTAAGCTPTFTVERQMEDINVPFFERFTGVKADQLALALGADEELIATLSTIGCDVVRGFQPYDRPDRMAAGGGTISITSGAATTSLDHTASLQGDLIIYRTGSSESNFQYFAAKITVRTSGTSYTVTTRAGATPANVSGATVIALYPEALTSGKLAQAMFGQRLTNAKAAASLNGVAGRLKTCGATIAQNIDGDTYEMDGSGARAGLPEGLYTLSGDFSARFTDTTILQLGTGDTSAPLAFTISGLAGQSLALSMPLCRIERRGPTMNGPAGVTFDSTYMAHKTAGGSPALTVTLLNQVDTY